MQLFKADIPVRNEIWKAAIPYLKSALEKTANEEWTLDDALMWVNNGDGMLLLLIDGPEIRAAAVVGVTGYHRQKKFEIHLMGADDLTEIDELFPQVIQIAKGFGCSHIAVKGRRWKKFLQQHGTTKETYITELEIGEM